MSLFWDAHVIFVTFFYRAALKLEANRHMISETIIVEEDETASTNESTSSTLPILDTIKDAIKDFDDKLNTQKPQVFLTTPADPDLPNPGTINEFCQDFLKSETKGMK